MIFSHIDNGLWSGILNLGNMKHPAYILILLLAFAQAALAVEPPEDGVYPGSINPALGIGNQTVSPALLKNLSRRSGQKGANLFVAMGRSGLPAVGTPKMLVLLVDFDEYPARAADTPEALAGKIFGAGGEFPYESLTNFYRRSSYNKLNIQGDVLGWFHAGKRADVPNTMAGREALIKRALESYTDYDFARYDNNGDGVVDYFAVIWTGPLGEWATFWWGVAPKFADKSFKLNGKSFYSYSWQGIVQKWDDPDSKFKINTLIHETGHALGLPDYYDYKPGVGPDGGLGYLDMMDSTRYDHNCFSKMLLGWTDPKVVTLGGELTLHPATDSGECIMVMPKGQAFNPFGEYFLIENRRKTGNDGDKYFPPGGLVVFHVDARLNSAGTNFRFNNQETEHKLLRLMESDGLEELETGKIKNYGFNDFYLKDRELGPETVPSNKLYDGTDPGLSLVSHGGSPDAAFTLVR